ncbi:hypothetical protein [Shimia sp.]|uniref:hypothetical protein n=1 Tax=Shimia sp. TaxID=1954381 RepID=UPI00356ADE8E
MQIALHTGAHYTDDDKLLKSLGKNRDFLAERGISLPKPRSYRKTIRDHLNAARAAGPQDGARDAVLAGMIDNSVEAPDRLVLSNSNFFCVPRLAIRDNIYYPQADERLQDFCNLFPGDEIEVFMAIRNPATFLPALNAATPERSDAEMTLGLEPTALRWSELVHRMRLGAPNVALTVWCNEDTPMIWEQLMRELSGIEATAPMAGGDDLLHEIMSPEGLERFDSYMGNHPGMTEMQKRRVIAAFMDKFALEDEVEEELDFNGWTEDYIDVLTEIYDEDVYDISRIPGVTLITP